MGSDTHLKTRNTSFRSQLLRIFSGFTLLIVVTLTVINLLSDIQGIKRNSAKQAELMGKQLAASIRLPLFAGDIPTLQRQASDLVATYNARTVTITSPQGHVLATAGKPATSDAISHETTVLPLGEGQGTEQVLGLQETNNQPLGKVIIAMDNALLQQDINQQIISAGFTALLFWLAFTYLSTLIVRWISSAMAPLIGGLRAIQYGDFSTRITTTRHDELAEATTAINELAQGLQQRDEENLRLQQELLDAMKNEVREERRQLMAKLIQTNRMTSLGLLASSMAHEINTPNGAIKLAGQQMTRVWADAVPILERVAAEEGDFSLGGAEFSVVRQEMGKGMEIIGRSSNRINQVISDLRAYSLGEKSTALALVDINQVVADALAIVMAHGQLGKVSIERQLCDDLPPVTGNRYHLGQVFTNLLMNGMQAIPHGRPGSLVVTTGYAAEQHQVVVTVQDNGAGIAEEIRNNLLEPFFTTRLDDGGSGLGLYIANFIITNHQGTMLFDSRPDDGTTVTVCIPAVVGTTI